MRSDTGRQSKASMLELRMRTGRMARIPRCPRPWACQPIAVHAPRNRPAQSRTPYTLSWQLRMEKAWPPHCAVRFVCRGLSLSNVSLYRRKKDIQIHLHRKGFRQILVALVPASGCIERLSLQSSSSPNLPHCPFTVVECSHVILVIPNFCLQDAQSFFVLGLTMAEYGWTVCCCKLVVFTIFYNTNVRVHGLDHEFCKVNTLTSSKSVCESLCINEKVFGFMHHIIIKKGYRSTMNATYATKIKQ